MENFQIFLQSLVLYSEGICAITGLLYYNQLKNTFWKWFVWYCCLILASELFSKFGLVYYPNYREVYFEYFGIPIQFLFLFWLFAKKSLQSKHLFIASLIVYFLSFIPHFFSQYQIKVVNSLNYTTGCFLLLIITIFEFKNQIRSEEILNFKSNKMFYINIGVILFYVGTLPFFAFYKTLYLNHEVVWDYYKTFFLCSVNLMYLLFAASFIWGKPTR